MHQATSVVVFKRTNKTPWKLLRNFWLCRTKQHSEYLGVFVRKNFVSPILAI